MNPEVKTLWLAGLRDRKRFLQGDGTLKRVNEETGEVRHCCLGVLCDLAIEAGVPVEIESFSTSTFSKDTYFDGTSDFLPASVMAWAGLESHNPQLMDFNGGDRKHVSDLNDNGYSFMDIAQLIENQL